MAALKDTKDVVAFQQGIKELNDELRLTPDELTQATAAIKNYNSSIGGAATATKLFSTVVSNWQTAFAAAADLMYGNINELVNYYNAQINAISAQNNYTQAIALQSQATVLFGQGSEQATRATTAATYVGALYTQAKENEVVTYEQYVTATAQNLATIAQSFINMIGALEAFQVAQAAFSAGELLGPLGLIAALAVGGGVAAASYASLPKSSALPSFDTGGYVAQTGLAMVHAGETVIPASGSSASGAQIHIHVNNSIDLAKVRQEVQNALSSIHYKAQRQRGVY